MINNHPKVSIVVLNYNGKRYLDDCFQSLAEVDYPNFEVVMVDNNSTDDSVEYIKRTYQWVRIIQTGRNGGFAFGNNFGIKETDGKYVFLLSNDTIATKDFLHKVVEVAESNSDVGVVGAYLLPPKCKGCEYLLSNIPSKRILADSVWGIAMLIRRDILERVGLLDETCFIMWEDCEYGWRANLLGYKVILACDAVIYHIGAATLKAIKYLYTKEWMYEFLKNKIYIYLKVRSPFYLVLFLPYEIIRSFARIPYYKWYYNVNMLSAILKAWKWSFHHLKETFEKRRGIMRGKKISDWKLLKLILYKDNFLKRYKLCKDCIKETANGRDKT